MTLSFGNASGVDRDAGVMLIKPSGFPYDDLRPEHLVAVSLADGKIVEGELRPSSDTPTHLLLYQRFAWIGGVVHTHSTAAVAGHRRCAPSRRSGQPTPTISPGRSRSAARSSATRWRGLRARDGRVIAATLEDLGLDPLEMPVVLVASHGPFTWGADAGRPQTTPSSSRRSRGWPPPRSP